MSQYVKDAGRSVIAIRDIRQHTHLFTSYRYKSQRRTCAAGSLTRSMIQVIGFVHKRGSLGFLSRAYIDEPLDEEPSRSLPEPKGRKGTVRSANVEI